jgi:ABC-type antimicrobial peptide transport system permease subunit
LFLFARLSARAPEVLVTMIIFALSSGVVGGVLFYMDSAAPSVLAATTADVPIDMQVSFSQSFYGQNETSIQNITTGIREQDYVLAAEDVVVAQIFDFWEEDWEHERKAFLGVDNTSIEAFSGAITVTTGELGFDDNSCLVEESVFARKNLEIGSDYYLQLQFYDSNWEPVFVNLTFTVVGTFTSNVYMSYSYYDGSESTYLHLITTKDAVHSSFSMLGHDFYNGIMDKIWVKFDKAEIASADAATITEQLRWVKSTIEQAYLPNVYVSSEDFGLLQAVYEYSLWFGNMRTITLAFSIPSVFMGIMLVQYNGKLVEDARRRDVGTLKTRGASGWQAFAWVLTSALVVGLVGSIGAVLTGILGALISGSVRELLVFDPELFYGFSIFLQPVSVISVFLFSFSIGALVAIPPAIRALIMSATEAHGILSKETLTGTEKMGSAATDVAATAISAYLLFNMLSLLFMPFFTISLISIAVILIPLLAIFLFFFTRLFARFTAGIKSSVLRRFRSPSLVVGARLASRTVTMFKKSEAMGTMFIAMVFTAGLFAAISSTTGTAHMRQIYMFQTGGDIAVEFNSGLENVTAEILENMTAVEGVEQATPILRTSGYALYREAYPWGGSEDINRSITVYAVEPESWLTVGFWLDYFMLEGSPSTSIPLLAQGGLDTINIMTSFKPVSHYVMDSSGWNYYPVFGNSLDLQLVSEWGWTNTTEGNIVDVLASRRDDSYSATKYLTGEPDETNFIVADIDYVHQCLNTSKITKVVLSTAPGANYTQVMRDLYDIAPYSISSILCAQEMIDEVLESRATQTVYGAYTLNVLFSLVYLTFGMVIVANLRIRNLKKQISILRALGTEPGSLMKGFLVETAVGVILAAAIGGLIGGALSYFVLGIPLVYTGTQTFTMWYRLPVLLQLPFALITGIVVATVVISQVATYYVMRRTLALNIAEEIQYTE